MIYPTCELVAIVYRCLSDDYGVRVSPDYITSYIAEMNDNVSEPYVDAIERDAEDIANQIYASMEARQ